MAEDEMRLTILEDRVHVLEEDILHNSEFIKRSMLRISDAVRTESTEREISEDRKAKDLKLAESLLTLDLNIERANRKENEMRILKEIDERCIRISLEIEEVMAKPASAYPQEFSSSRQDFETEVKRRQQFEEDVILKIDSEAKLLQELLFTEKRLREDSTSTMTSLLENFQARFSEELLKEQRARQATEKTILHLIEDIGKKIERK